MTGHPMLILVVGPSGAGKDTLIGVAQNALAADPRFRFVRRVITRPSHAGGEAHDAVSEAAFAQRQFALKWQAHGLHYGIPLDIIADADASTRFPVRVIEVTAPPEILAARLAGRGRESPQDVVQRLARDVPIPSYVSVETIVNDGTPAEAADRFINALLRAASPAPPG